MPGPKTFLRKYSPELLLLLLYAWMSAIYDSRVGTHLDIDSHRYLELGQRLLETGRFQHIAVSGGLTPDYSRTPAFPAIIAGALAVTGKSTSAAIYLVTWLQRLLWAASVCWLLPRVLSTSGAFRRWTLAGKVVLLFSPVVIHHGALLLTDLLYAAGLLAVIRLNFFALRRSRIAGASAGLFHGMLTLLRPVHLLVPVLMCLPYLRKRLMAVAVILAFSAVPPAAWVVRNHSGTGKVFLVALGGRALALHQETSIRQMRPQDSSAQYGPEFIAALHSTNENPITAAWILMRDHQLSEVEADAVAKAVAMDAIQRRPWLYVKQTLQNIGRLFWSRIDGYNLAQVLAPAAGETIWRVGGVLNGIWGVLVFAVIPAALFMLRYPPRAFSRSSIIAVASVGLYLVFVPCLTTITYGRFLLPLLPIIGLVYCMADLHPRKKFVKALARENEKEKVL